MRRTTPSFSRSQFEERFINQIGIHAASSSSTGPLHNTPTNQHKKTSSALLHNSSTTLMSYSVFHQHDNTHHRRKWDDELDDRFNNNNSNRHNNHHSNHHQTEQELVELTRKTRSMMRALLHPLLFLHSFLPPAPMWMQRLFAVSSFLRRKQRSSKTGSNSEYFSSSFVQSTLSSSSSSSKSMCGFLTCQFIRSAAVMQFCIVVGDNDNEHKHLPRQGRHKNEQNHHQEQINNQRRKSSSFYLASKNGQSTVRSSSSSSSSSIAHKSALHISNMVARIEGWGNHHHSSSTRRNRSNNASNQHQREGHEHNEHTEHCLDSLLHSNRVAAEYLKSCGKPRVKIGKTMIVRSSPFATHTRGIINEQEVEEKIEFVKHRTSPEVKLASADPHHHHRIIVTTTMVSKSPSSSSTSPAVVIPAPAASKIVSSTTNSTTSPSFIEARRNLFRPTTFHNISTSMSNPPIVQIISKEASLSHLNSETIVFHPPQMSATLAARVEHKTRELEKAFSQTSIINIISSNSSDNQNNNNNHDNINNKIASWTSALRTWISETGRFATMLRSHDDSVTGFRLATSISRLSLAQSSPSSSSTSLGKNDHLQQMSSQVQMIMRNYNMNRRRVSHHKVVANNKRNEENDDHHYQESTMTLQRNNSNNNQSSSSSSSSLDVAVITRHAWFASVYCGLWREALAVGGPPLIVASALIGMANGNNNIGNPQSSSTSSSMTKAACAAYLMSFQSLLISQNTKMKRQKEVSPEKENQTNYSGLSKSSTSEKLRSLVRNSSSAAVGHNSPMKKRVQMCEVASSSSLGCFLALQSVKEERANYNHHHHHNQKMNTSNNHHNINNTNACWWHDALKIMKVLSYRGHPVSATFHIRLSNSLVYGPDFNDRGVSLEKMTTANVSNNNINWNQRKPRNWVPATMILQHVCCDSTNAFKAWSFAKSQIHREGEAQEQREKTVMGEIKDTTNDYSLRPMIAELNATQISIKAEDDEPVPAPQTLRQTVQLTRRMLQDGKTREAYQTILEQEMITLPPTQTSSQQQFGTGGKIVRERLVAAIAAKRRREKEISKVNVA